LCVSAYSYCFAQGAVVSYATSFRWFERFPAATLESFPSNDQLNRLTHVIAMGIGPFANGTLFTSNLPNSWNGSSPPNDIWNGSQNRWLASLVSRAHQRGAKVSICISGESVVFRPATNGSTLNTFVTSIVNFVNVHNLDGVNINWEYPGRLANGTFDAIVQNRINEWNQCIALMQELKHRLPNKKISISLSARVPENIEMYPNATIPQQIWEEAHVIYLMTYDVEWPAWQTHSLASHANGRITHWANWGTTGGRNLDIRKLHVGSAFYGWPTMIVGSGNIVS